MTCPVCGAVVWDDKGERPEQLCLPSTCPAWGTEARYDHEDRTWLPVDAAGYDLKGRQ